MTPVQKIDALQAEMDAHTAEFIASMNEGLESLDAHGVRIERLKHRVAVCHERLNDLTNLKTRRRRQLQQ